MEVALSDNTVREATSGAMQEDDALREAAVEGTLTLKMVRNAVIARLGLGDEGAKRLKETYKDCMKAEMLAVAHDLQTAPKPKVSKKPKVEAPKPEKKAPKPEKKAPRPDKPKAAPKPKRKVEAPPEPMDEDDFDDGDDDDESAEDLDDDEVAEREKRPHKDDTKFAAHDSSGWTALYGEVAWVESQGFKHWPSIIYDPRWTQGGINARGMRNLGKMHTCIFYGMSASERFAFEPPEHIVEWDEGLKRGFDKCAAEFKPKRYEKAFPKAVETASADRGKPTGERYPDLHRAGPKKPAAPRKKKAPRKDDDFIDRDDDASGSDGGASDDDVAALKKAAKKQKRAGGDGPPKKRLKKHDGPAAPRAPPKPKSAEDKKRALEAAAAKKKARDDADRRVSSERDARVKEAQASGVPVWKQLSERPSEKAAVASAAAAAAATAAACVAVASRKNRASSGDNIV
mmetsp:Transcript_3908/g.11789  ORF Transcript_3908/g.11789 Transcript_3908/m.11789 type:complete len:458 (-) Transcript_3908:449-1822(-)